ncbi:MAG: hypothetical protein AAGB34_07120 [Planctomycetota bacterium]
MRSASPSEGFESEVAGAVETEGEVSSASAFVAVRLVVFFFVVFVFFVVRVRRGLGVASDSFSAAVPAD